MTSKLDIVLAVPGLPFNGETFDALAIGGSESAGYYMGRALAKRGHRVTTFCNTDKRVQCADVDYLPFSMFTPYTASTLHDVCVVQRMPALFGTRSLARFSALWCHDLAMLRQEAAVKGVAWNYDRVFVLSEFMRKQYKEVYGLPDELVFLTRNGVDLETVAKVREALPVNVTRNPLSLVFAARPERGLDVLLEHIMPRILRYEPQARLFVCSYFNPIDHLREFYGKCEGLARVLGDRVVYLGNLTKEKLYELFHTAGQYVYPVPSIYAPEFDEIYGIAVAEAQACGLPVVSSTRGALPETLGTGAGVLIDKPVHTPEYYDAFAEAVLRYMRSPAEWRQATAAGLTHAQSLDWAGVAGQWEELFFEGLKAKSSNLATLANHFWRRSDIYAARECLARLPIDDGKSAAVRERIARDWSFVDNPDGFRDQYEKIGATHDPSVLTYAAQEPRYAALRQWLQKHSDVTKVLDYGCAHGAYATNLLRELPGLEITGVDIDQHGIEMAYTFARQLGVEGRWRGVVGGEERLSDATVPEMREQYDVVVVQEVLEHVRDPSALLRAVEGRVKDNGYVYITVPFGPWEYSDYRRYPYRAHLWELDLHDLHDMLEGVKGKEAEVGVFAMTCGSSQETDDPLGWWVVQYRVTPGTRGKVGAIDMERKLLVQAPRQTVSVAIIAGPSSEETLHWCLRSLVHVADEVVIADCGLSEEAKRIIESYRWRELMVEGKIVRTPHPYLLDLKVVPGVDPKVHGFETPRNIALEHCTQDWVLWIDTDEKLLDANHLHKYLRGNVFQGYSIKQHHFAVDTHFDADLPVRLFRNNGQLHFVGCIHEHPERAVNEGPGLTVVLGDVHIPHVGYLVESGRKARFARNLPMLEADMRKYPNRILQKHFIMRDNMLLNTYELQHNGGKITENIRLRAQQVVALWREYFKGKVHISNVDPIDYYSQAVALLGEGFDAVIQVSADKVDAKMNGALKARFANMDDYMTEVTVRAKRAAEPFEARYY